MTTDRPEEPSRLAGNTLLTAVSQIVVMGLGALLALAALLLFGTTAETDGLFVAYGVYGVLLMVAQSLRTTVVARLMEGATLWESFDEHVRAVVAIALIAAVPMILLGDLVAGLLTGTGSGPAHDSARFSLALLTLAAVAQLNAALGAAALGTLGRFAAPSAAYLAGGACSLVGVVALSSPLGVDAVAVAVAGGSLLTYAVIVRSLLRAGWRPRLGRGGPVGRRIVQMLLGAAFYGSLQLMLVITVAFAARLGEGSATVYTYAYYAASAVAGGTSGSVAIVLAAPIAEGWDRSPASLTPTLRLLVRLGTTLIAPLLGAAAVAGPQLAETVLGGSMAEADARTLVWCFLGLGGYMLGLLAVMVPLLAAFAQGRYRAVAVAASAALLAHAALSAMAMALTDGLVILAAVTSFSTIVLLVSGLAVVYGRSWPGALAAGADELVRPLLLTGVVFGAAWIASELLGGVGTRLALTVLASALYAAALRARLPEHWALVQRLVAPLLRFRPAAR